MKQIKRFVVVTQVLEATLSVPDEWTEESGEMNMNDIVASKPVAVEDGAFFVPRFFETVEAAHEFEYGEIGRL